MKYFNETHIVRLPNDLLPHPFIHRTPHILIASPLSFNVVVYVPNDIVVDQKELLALYKHFRKETATNGGITRAELEQTMKMMGMMDAAFQQYLFTFFDADQDGVIGFVEYIHALSILTRGTNNEKLERTSL